jgi:hypothetical protein
VPCAIGPHILFIALSDMGPPTVYGLGTPDQGASQGPSWANRWRSIPTPSSSTCLQDATRSTTRSFPCGTNQGILDVTARQLNKTTTYSCMYCMVIVSQESMRQTYVPCLIDDYQIKTTASGLMHAVEQYVMHSRPCTSRHVRLSRSSM